MLDMLSLKGVGVGDQEYSDGQRLVYRSLGGRGDDGVVGGEHHQLSISVGQKHFAGE